MSWKECCLKQKYGGLELVDLEAAKTSLLCKWIVKAMEPRESNLQLMLRYKLARYNPQRGRSWGVSLYWFTSKQHIGVLGSKVWSHIGKVWRIMVKGTYQLPPRNNMELLHSNIWWSEGWNFSKMNLPMLKVWNYIAKVSNVWMTRGVHLHLRYVYTCENPLFNGGVFTFLCWIFSTL